MDAGRIKRRSKSMATSRYVTIQPMAGPDAPTPHPVHDGRFDTSRVYKVLGTYHADRRVRLTGQADKLDTSDQFAVLSNPDGQIWFISEKHLAPAGTGSGDATSIPLDEWHLSHPKPFASAVA